MASSKALQELLDFFESVGFAGLKLPNGWFGKPHDNLHRLTEAYLVDEKMIIELDGRLKLTLTGSIEARRDGLSLSLNEFSIADWRWQEYGSNVIYRESFTGGKIRFIGRLG
jgi:hypothetical protein